MWYDYSTVKYPWFYRSKIKGAVLAETNENFSGAERNETKILFVYTQPCLQGILRFQNGAAGVETRLWQDCQNSIKNPSFFGRIKQDKMSSFRLNNGFWLLEN